MSAIPMVDLNPLNQYAVDQNNEVPLTSHVEPTASTALQTDSPPIQPTASNASQAHQQTHWTDVQQSYGLHGDRQTVAIIDTGIAWDHVALGKGFGPGYRVVGGWDFAENDAKPYDDGPAGYHGTHVAGIVGAKDSTRSGVVSDVDLVALRVFDDAGRGNWSGPRVH